MVTKLVLSCHCTTNIKVICHCICGTVTFIVPLGVALLLCTLLAGFELPPRSRAAACGRGGDASVGSRACACGAWSMRLVVLASLQ